MKKVALVVLAIAVLGISAYIMMASASAGKVVLCHYPPGNWANCHTIEVGAPAAEAHLTYHEMDHLGPCTPGCAEIYRPHCGDGICQDGMKDAYGNYLPGHAENLGEGPWCPDCWE